MAKDAKGHGSEKRGGAGDLESRAGLVTLKGGRVGFNVNPKTGPTPEQKAYAARQMYGSTDPRTIAAMHGISTGHLSGGPHKVQTLALDRAGKPWATAKAYRNRTVAERVAQHMRQDGGYTRVKTK